MAIFCKFVYMYPTDAEETCVRGRRRAEPQADPIRFLQSEGSEKRHNDGRFSPFPPVPPIVGDLCTALRKNGRSLPTHSALRQQPAHGIAKRFSPFPPSFHWHKLCTATHKINSFLSPVPRTGSVIRRTFRKQNGSSAFPRSVRGCKPCPALCKIDRSAPCAPRGAGKRCAAFQNRLFPFLVVRFFTGSCRIRHTPCKMLRCVL